MRAVFYFLLTNLAVLVLAGIMFSLISTLPFFAENPDLTGSLGGLFLICAVFGTLGSFVSLLMSKPIAKWSSKTRIIKEPSTGQERWLVRTVNELADAEGIGRPDVGIFPAAQANAFATGWNRNRALVAVSEGLMRQMDEREVRAVLAHEVAHISNGDMLIMTLIQGVLNTFVMFFARLIGFVIDSATRRRDSDSGGVGFGFYIGTFVAEIFLGLLASLVVFSFSRRREFKADATAARLTSHRDMIAALRRLQGERVPVPALPEGMKAMGISSGKAQVKASLFSTHPPLELRIQALEQALRGSAAVDANG